MRFSDFDPNANGITIYQSERSGRLVEIGDGIGRRVALNAPLRQGARFVITVRTSIAACPLGPLALELT